MVYALFMCTYWAGRPELDFCRMQSTVVGDRAYCQQLLDNARSGLGANIEGVTRIDGIIRTVKFECKGRKPEWQNVD